MSVGLWGFKYDFSDLPVWRKVVICCAAALFVLIGSTRLIKELDIYASAPASPLPETRQTHPVQVMHGYVRFVTQEEEASWRFWTGTASSNIGILVIVGLLTWATYRGPRGRPGLLG